MARIAPVKLENADQATADTLRAVDKKIGMIPNLFATFAQSPTVLNAYLGLSEELSKGRLNASQREIVALAVGQANACQYCLSAHTLMGKGAGLSDEAIARARTGAADGELDNAIAALAVKIVRQRGVLSDDDMKSAHDAGVDDGLVMEIIANVALNTLTNYTNHIAGTDIDFPVVSL
ncbi:carboxymuconolactone decarboxylase family protein [Granulosicoccus sp. 3-233]|uniref:carboxymuconolactone decarboxylase family protein n=1 Tax=Granulosicoccus sp. 3-233 TaxID=3417969 RepID=UPI003D34C95E